MGALFGRIHGYSFWCVISRNWCASIVRHIVRHPMQLLLPLQVLLRLEQLQRVMRRCLQRWLMQRHMTINRSDDDDLPA